MNEAESAHRPTHMPGPAPLLRGKTSFGRRGWHLRRLVSGKELLVLGAFLGIFLMASALSDAFSEPLERLLGPRLGYGVLIYLAAVIIGEVALPGSTLPLLPIFAALRGNLPTALATALGWLLSAIIAFAVARRLGARLLLKLLSQEQLTKVAGAIPRGHLFRAATLFRLVFPVGIMSYALALFTGIRWPAYLLSSAITLIPYAFLLVWVATWPLAARLIADVLGIALTGAAYLWIRRRVVRQFRPLPRPQPHPADGG